MIDAHGKQLGEITDIHLDRETDRPEWAGVRTGRFGLRSSFVPLAEAIEVGNDIQVPHPRSWSRTRPTLRPMGSCRRLRRLNSTATAAWSTTP
jgi:hypothetical protein